MILSLFAGKLMSPMKKLILFMIICVLVLLSGWIGFVWWDRGAPPGFRPSLEAVSVNTINRYHRGVRISGMARHDLRIKMKVSGEERYLFPLMDSKDFNAKLIKVMILSPKPPSQIASLEERTIEGIARPPGNLVSPDSYKSWQRKGFEFAPKFVLIEEFPPSNDQP